MFNPIQFYEAGKARSGTALIPFFDSTSVAFGISTRNGDTVVDWGDSSYSNIAPVKMRDYADGSALSSNFNKSYSSALNGNVSVKFLRGLKDIYSVYLGVIHDTNQKSKLNILDVETFFHQFPNLFSLCIQEYAYQTTARMSVIKGDLAKLPNSVERVLINVAEVIGISSGELYLNFSNYTNSSNLKYFNVNPANNYLYPLKFMGDLGKLPTSCQFLRIANAKVFTGSAITYTAGKIWASDFDTLSIPLSLTTAELDNLLIDMQNSVTSVGAGIIALGGYRSAMSDSAVAYLQGLGRTVNISTNKVNANNFTDSALLRLDFQNNFDVYSNSGINISDGSNYANRPTFALSGRKAGEYCAVFNGSQSIKTTTNLPINSDKVTIKFWMKTTQTTTAIVAELTSDYSINNAFAVLMRAGVKVNLCDRVSSINSVSSSSLLNSWKRVAISVDRKLGINQTNIYVDGVLDTTLDPSSRSDNNGNFVNNILFIGQRGGSTLGYTGSLMHLELLNYTITASEALADYNSFL